MKSKDTIQKEIEGLERHLSEHSEHYDKMGETKRLEGFLDALRWVMESEGYFR